MSNHREGRPEARSGSDDVAIEALVRRAWTAVIAFVATTLVTVGASVGAHVAGRAADVATLTKLLLVLTAVAAGYAVITSGRPIRRRTGFDVDFMVGRVWLPGFLGLLIPPVALVDAVLRLTSRSIGGYQTIREGGAGGRSYPEVLLTHGEGRPLGVALLTITALWPAAVATALGGQWLFAR